MGNLAPWETNRGKNERKSLDISDGAALNLLISPFVMTSFVPHYSALTFAEPMRPRASKMSDVAKAYVRGRLVFIL